MEHKHKDTNEEGHKEKYSTLSHNRDTWLLELTSRYPHLHTQEIYEALTHSLAQVREKEAVERSRPHFSELATQLTDCGTQHRALLESLRFGYSIEKEEVHIDASATPHISPEALLLSHRILDDLFPLIAPWRKGSFSIHGTHIESEWRSYLKWQRLTELYDIDLLCKNKTILDVGCNNGYYGFCMLSHGARSVLGIDPMPRQAFFFELYRILMPQLPMYFEGWGVEQMEVLPDCFDTVFCMGILYHQRNPLAMLETLRSTLKKKGTLVLETICLNSEEPYCLFPTERYQKAKGYWFIPSKQVLVSWLQRTGYSVLAVGDPVKTNFDEQRRTEWIRGESLESFLKEDDVEKTVEGYPAPYRVSVIAERRY